MKYYDPQTPAWILPLGKGQACDNLKRSEPRNKRLLQLHKRRLPPEIIDQYSIETSEELVTKEDAHVDGRRIAGVVPGRSIFASIQQLLRLNRLAILLLLNGRANLEAGIKTFLMQIEVDHATCR